MHKLQLSKIGNYYESKKVKCCYLPIPRFRFKVLAEILRPQFDY